MQPIYDVAIIGGGPAGSTALLRTLFSWYQSRLRRAMNLYLRFDLPCAIHAVLAGNITSSFSTR